MDRTDTLVTIPWYRKLLHRLAGWFSPDVRQQTAEEWRLSAQLVIERTEFEARIQSLEDVLKSQRLEHELQIESRDRDIRLLAIERDGAARACEVALQRLAQIEQHWKTEQEIDAARAGMAQAAMRQQ